MREACEVEKKYFPATRLQVLAVCATSSVLKRVFYLSSLHQHAGNAFPPNLSVQNMSAHDLDRGGLGV